jgi:hypothetical protein
MVRRVREVKADPLLFAHPNGSLAEYTHFSNRTAVEK